MTTGAGPNALLPAHRQAPAEPPPRLRSSSRTAALPFAKTAGRSDAQLVGHAHPAHEGASLKIAAKFQPVMRLRTVNMDFFYGSSFMVDRLSLRASGARCMRATPLFAREDEVERAWGLVDRIEAGWASQPRAVSQLCLPANGDRPRPTP